MRLRQPEPASPTPPEYSALPTRACSLAVWFRVCSLLLLQQLRTGLGARLGDGLLVCKDIASNLYVNRSQPAKIIVIPIFGPRTGGEIPEQKSRRLETRIGQARGL